MTDETPRQALEQHAYCGHAWEDETKLGIVRPHRQLVPSFTEKCGECRDRLKSHEAAYALGLAAGTHHLDLANLADVLCCVSQIFNGWRPDEAWSQWDEEVAQRVVAVQRQLEAVEQAAATPKDSI